MSVREETSNEIIRIGNAILEKDCIRDILHEIRDYDSVISLSDVGHRCNFMLVNRLTGRRIRFKKGRRVRS